MNRLDPDFKSLLLWLTECDTWFMENLNKRKPLMIRPFCLFSLSQYDRWRSSCTSRGMHITAGIPWWSLLQLDFSYSPLAPSRRYPGEGWGQLAPSSPSAKSPTLRKSAEMVKKPRRSLLWPPHTLMLAPSLSSHLANWVTTWQTS